MSILTQNTIRYTYQLNQKKNLLWRLVMIRCLRFSSMMQKTGIIFKSFSRGLGEAVTASFKGVVQTKLKFHTSAQAPPWRRRLRWHFLIYVSGVSQTEKFPPSGGALEAGGGLSSNAPNEMNNRSRLHGFLRCIIIQTATRWRIFVVFFPTKTSVFYSFMYCLRVLSINWHPQLKVWMSL